MTEPDGAPDAPAEITDPVEIARWAHEVNRAVQVLTGEEVSPPWDDAPDWQRESAMDGVAAHLTEALSPEESHARWLAHKIADGWTYGPVKDSETRQHPCMVPYDQLPAGQRIKDHLFRAVVAGLTGADHPGPVDDGGVIADDKADGTRAHLEQIGRAWAACAGHYRAGRVVSEVRHYVPRLAELLDDAVP